MAILDSVSGVSVHVSTGGRALREWHDTHEDEDRPNKVVRYVEAVSGQHFTVTVTVGRQAEYRKDLLRFYLHADGMFIGCHGVYPQRARSQLRVFEGALDGDLVHKFRFSELRTVEDEIPFGGDGEHLERIGELEIRVHHVTKEDLHDARPKSWRTSRKVATDAYRRVEPFNNVGVISEKDVKGRSVTHSIRFDDSWVGEQKPCKEEDFVYQSDVFTGYEPCKARESSSSTDTKDIKPSTTKPPARFVKGPLAGTYIFRYRSEAALRSMLVIPRTPTPSEPPQFPAIPAFGEVNHGARQSNVSRDFDRVRAAYQHTPELDYGDNFDPYRQDGKWYRRGNSEEIKIRGAAGVKREREDEDVLMDENPRPRKLHKPTADSIVFELGDDELFHQIFPCVTPEPQREMESIGLDEVL